MQHLEIDEFYRLLGKRIREIRESHKHNITQETLAKNIGMSRTSIVNIENGRHHIQIHTLVDICTILHISMNDVLPEIKDDTIHSISYSTKPFDLKEKKSINKVILEIEKEVGLNVRENKKNR